MQALALVTYFLEYTFVLTYFVRVNLVPSAYVHRSSQLLRLDLSASCLGSHWDLTYHESWMTDNLGV